MSDPPPRLRVVEAGAPPARNRRLPGPAVLVVLAYSLLFGAGLWMMRAWIVPARRGTIRPPAAGGAGPSDASRPSGGRSRATLLAGAWIPAAIRPRYFARLAAECCTCGCGLSVQNCLERDASCARSPELAEDIARTLR